MFLKMGQRVKLDFRRSLGPGFPLREEVFSGMIVGLFPELRLVIEPNKRLPR